MVCLIGLGVYPTSLVLVSYIESGDWGYSLGVMFGGIIFWSIVLGLYYMIKPILKRTKATFKHNEPVS